MFSRTLIPKNFAKTVDHIAKEQYAKKLTRISLLKDNDTETEEHKY